MKMDSAKVCGLLVASFLFLTLLGNPTAACSCAPRHPQTAYCNADFVIKGKFVGMSRELVNVSAGEPMSWIRYEIKTTKVFKGPKETQDVRFLNTPAMESVCGYMHKAPLKGEEYVIAGMLEDDRAMITACSFIQPWAQLSPAQKQGLMLMYSKGCNCTVLPCTSAPCSVTSDSQCLWADGIVAQKWDGFQAKNLFCLPQTNESDLCTWESLSSQARVLGNRRALLRTRILGL